MLPKSIRLYPHHYSILVREKEDDYKRWEEYMKYEFVDGNYFLPECYSLTNNSLRRMVNLFRELSNSPNTEIEVVNERDHICSSLCDNLVNGKCKYGEGTFTDDVDVLRYGLSYGQIITVANMFEKISSKQTAC